MYGANASYVSIRLAAGLLYMGDDSHVISKSKFKVYCRIIYLFQRSPTTKLQWNEPTKTNAWLSLLDTSPLRATNSEECDAAWRNKYFVFLHASPLYF